VYTATISLILGLNDDNSSKTTVYILNGLLGITGAPLYYYPSYLPMAIVETVITIRTNGVICMDMRI